MLSPARPSPARSPSPRGLRLSASTAIPLRSPKPPYAPASGHGAVPRRCRGVRGGGSTDSWPPARGNAHRPRTSAAQVSRRPWASQLLGIHRRHTKALVPRCQTRGAGVSGPPGQMTSWVPFLSRQTWMRVAPSAAAQEHPAVLPNGPPASPLGHRVPARVLPYRLPLG